MEIDLPAEDDPRRLEVRRVVRAEPEAHPEAARRRRVRGAALAAALRARRRSRAAAHHRRRDAARRRVEAGQPDRHRALRADPRRARERRAEGAVHLADAHRRGDVVPAVQRARRRLRPREPEHARRARRRRLRRQRPEDLDVARRARQVRHPDRAHQLRRGEAPRHLLLHHPDEPRRASRSGRSAT